MSAGFEDSGFMKFDPIVRFQDMLYNQPTQEACTVYGISRINIDGGIWVDGEYSDSVFVMKAAILHVASHKSERS